jgi:preprotein translocase subunit SecY
MPYITASIIIQLLAVVVPSLEKMQKEGEAGQRRLTQYTRYLTVALAAGQSAGYVVVFHKRLGPGRDPDALPDLNARVFILIVLSLTAGSTLLMWMGEYITRKGVGNGQSLLIFCSILTSIPTAISAWLNGSVFEKLSLPIVVLGVILAVVFINEGQRRIPIQYARRGATAVGQTTYMPLRVNMAGVIPVIFAAAVLLLPPTIGQLLNIPWLANTFAPTTWPSIILEFTLIVVFTFFYTAVIFNPVDQADNLKKYGGFIPGIRPGRPTAQFLDHVMVRLTLPGAFYLGIIAVLPTIFIRYAGFSQATARALGGTSVLIIVGVALDTMRQVQSQVMMRHYEGFLK